METFTEAKSLVDHPTYDSERRRSLEDLKRELSKGSIDAPILDVVNGFARLPYCYTLQSCFGHFMKEFSADDSNIKRLDEMVGEASSLHYRIAYIALCVEDSVKGRGLLEDMKAVAGIDPDYIQFGSADWFWNMNVNSYVLQVSPLRSSCQDHFNVSADEALVIERVRDKFLDQLRELLSRHERLLGCGPGKP